MTPAPVPRLPFRARHIVAALGIVALGCVFDPLGSTPLSELERRAVGAYRLVSLFDSTVPGALRREGVCDWLISTFRADRVISGELTLADDRSVTTSHTYRGQNAVSLDTVTLIPTYGGPVITKTCPSSTFAPQRWKIENGKLLFREPGLFGEPTPAWEPVLVSDPNFGPGNTLTFERAVYRKK